MDKQRAGGPVRRSDNPAAWLRSHQKHALCHHAAKNMFVMLPSEGLCVGHLTGPSVIIQPLNGHYSSGAVARRHPDVI